MVFNVNSLKNGIETIKQTVKQMPPSPGIYKMTAKDGSILYVGKAKNLPKRVISYARIEQMPNRLRRMVAQIDNIQYEVTNTEAEALLLEAGLIRSLKPPYNIALRDDKSFPYIWIDSKHQFPRISKFRGNPKNQRDYWGPFASVAAVSETIVEIQKIFNIRPCSDNYFNSRTRPCLEYQIQRCSAPCVNKISQEEYAASVNAAREFLSGKSTEIHQQLQDKMWQLADQKNTKTRPKFAIKSKR